MDDLPLSYRGIDFVSITMKSRLHRSSDWSKTWQGRTPNIIDIGAIEDEIKTFSLQDGRYTIDSNKAMGFLSIQQGSPNLI